jgi:hypothetical protein
MDPPNFDSLLPGGTAASVRPRFELAALARNPLRITPAPEQVHQSRIGAPARNIRTAARSRGLETRPFVSVLEARNRNQFALVKPGERSIDHVLRRHDDLRRQALPWEAGYLPEVGRGRARQHRLDANAFIGELVLQRITECNDVGFARAIHGVERFGGDATIDAMLMIVPAPRLTNADCATRSYRLVNHDRYR